eukprot:TRINITY_DN295_c0_g2_i1.p1 TRINITY_DN295_c0_g2~~TRINITY_DN295_c0_g2_i1.p1  ORF type:complete len:227 (-),score=32.23 TRINITY_DN295_c0_g2_i1:207-851(-)
MLAVSAHRAIYANAAPSAKKVAGRVSRQATTVKAVSAEETDNSRRAILGGAIVGLVGLAANGNKAQAVSGVDLFDDRKAIQKGFDIIYEARDLDLPQGVRDGMTQMKASLEATKTRVAESQKRLQTELPQYISKKYWTNAQNSLRNQVGTLRFDLNTLVAAKASKDAKKSANESVKDFLKDVESLDLALRDKNMDKANQAYGRVIKSLDNVLAA